VPIECLHGAVGQTYLYSRVPLTAGVFALGMAVEHAIDETDRDTWLRTVVDATPRDEAFAP
jgi:hypothetical protein